MKIAIASGKGGTGKTVLSVNLASYLGINKDVTLVDLDVEEPNSHLFISGEENHNQEIFTLIPSWDEEKCIRCGLCQDICNFNAIYKLGSEIVIFPDLCHSCKACSDLCPNSALPLVKSRIGGLRSIANQRINFIESRLDIGQEQVLPLISKTIDYVDSHCSNELKLFDSPPGTSCSVIEVVKSSDYVILITEPTPFGYYDLKLAVETVRLLKKPFGVVINKYGIGNDEVESFCKDEKVPILAKIPNDRRIAELYSKGSLLYPFIPEFKEQLEILINNLQDFKLI